MATEYGWLNTDCTAIYMRLEYDWTAQELIDLARNWYALAQTVSADPVLVIDLSNSRRMPDGLLPVLNEVVHYIPPGRYATMIVGVRSTEAKIVERLIRTFFPAVLHRLSFHSSMETARAVIEEGQSSPPAYK